MVPRLLPVPRFPDKEMEAIPEREPREVIQDYLWQLQGQSAEDRVAIARPLALEIARLLKPNRIKRSRRGPPPKTKREQSWDNWAVWAAEQLMQKLLARRIPKGKAAEQAAKQIAASYKRARGLSWAAIMDALSRKSLRIRKRRD